MPLAANKDLYVVDIDHAETKKVSLSSAFAAVKTILLRADDSLLVGKIDKMLVGDQGIFVLDRDLTKGVYLFSDDGSFIRRFGTTGNGPGEYIVPFDFSLDREHKQVYILDRNKQRINKYDIESGKFAGYIMPASKDGALHYHIQYVDGALFADAYFGQPSENSYLLQKIDPATGAQQAAYLNNAYNQGWENLNDVENVAFYPVGTESARFVERFMDTVVYVSAKEVKPYLVVRTDGWMRSEDLQKFDRNKKQPTFMMDLFLTGKAFGINDYIEKEGSFIYFRYVGGRKARSVVYNIKTKETKLVGGLKDDLLFAADVLKASNNALGCTTEEGVYFYDNSPSDNLRKWAQDGMLSPGLDKLDELKSLKDDCNPVVFFYKYKK